MIKKLSPNNTEITVKSEWRKGSIFSFTLEDKKDEVMLEIEEDIQQQRLEEEK